MDTPKVGRTKRATQYTDVSVILEIAGHPNGKDADRFLAALKVLRRSAINGCSVVAVHHTYEDATNVPGYGHNYRCKEVCICDVQPWSVLRYFQVYVTVRGVLPVEALRMYKLGEYARLDVCGLTEPQMRGCEELQVLG